MASMDCNSPIRSFYAEKTLFITGATGFLGKVLVEKLLRSCPDLKKIYILMRSKRGKDTEERLEQMLNLKLFEHLRTKNPNCFKKLSIVEGDITLPGFGLSDKDRDAIIEETNIVFHSAATVKFDEPLKVAVTMNILGTKWALELAKQMKQLMSFVYISTAYSNCNRSDVEEIIYPPPFPPSKLIDMCQWMEEKILTEITDCLIRPRPNTYTFTKAVAESLLQEEGGNLPISIFRPSIVVASMKDPFPGWIDNFNGPSGIFVVVAKGLLRSMMLGTKMKGDLIPVDVVVHVLMAVGWITALKRSDEITVYHCTPEDANRITWKEVADYAFPAAIKYPPGKVFRYPSCSIESRELWNKIHSFFQHNVVAFAVDTYCRLTGRKPRMQKLFAKMLSSAETIFWFSRHQWEFRNKNCVELYNQLSESDKKEFLFPTDMKNMPWETYFKEYILGVRRYVLNEDDSTLPLARKRLLRTYFWSLLGVSCVMLGVVSSVYFHVKDFTSVFKFLGGSISLM